MKVRNLVLLALPTFLLASCGSKDRIHVSRPKEVIEKNSKYGELSISKTNYSYDKKGNVIEEIDYDFDNATGQYVLAQKIVYTYDNKGNETSSERYSYEDGVEKLASKVVSTYTDNLLTKVDFYAPDDSGNLYVTERYSDFVYDSKNRELSSNTYQFDTETQEFVLSEKSTYTYQGDIMEFQKLVTEDLIYGSEYNVVVERKFDEKGRIIEDKGTVGNAFCEADLYTYTEEGMVASCGTYMVDIETGKYNIISVFETIYTKEFYPIEESHMFYNYDEDPGTIDGFAYVEYTYDSTMNVTSEKEYKLDMETGEYVLVIERSKSY